MCVCALWRWRAVQSARTEGLLNAEAAARAEAQQRAEAERARVAAAAKRAADEAAAAAAAAVAAAAAEAERARKATADAAAQAAAEAAAAARAASPQAPPGPSNGGVIANGTATPRTLVTPAAAAEAASLSMLLSQTRAAAAPFSTDTSRAAPRRALEKRISRAVQQLAGTKDQVARKAAELDALLREPNIVASPAASAHLQLWLCAKIVGQADAQVAHVRGFAYALAELMAALAPAHPALLPLLRASLQACCVLCVPKYLPYTPSAYPSQDAYFEAMGYVREGGGTGAEGGAGGFESTDAFAMRTAGCVALYAALLQMDAPGSSAGGGGFGSRVDMRGFGNGGGGGGGAGPAGALLPSAWAFLARLLNKLPPTRLVATALDAFLQIVRSFSPFLPCFCAPFDAVLLCFHRRRRGGCTWSTGGSSTKCCCSSATTSCRACRRRPTRTRPPSRACAPSSRRGSTRRRTRRARCRRATRQAR
jgi:hypothetical protein